MGPVQADVETIHELSLPAPGTMVHLSPAFVPAILKGIKVHPDNPFRFEFIMDVGAVINRPYKDDATRLIKYFLASLTIPEKDLWVNLSPYEKDRIVPDAFGKTEMGRDLLAQDYMLKQITASLIYPEDAIGKKFWKRVYEEAVKKSGGSTTLTINTFNKVWIVPEKAVVYENAKAGTAYVVESKLKVMLEQDYLAESKLSARGGSASGGKGMLEEDYVALNKNSVGVGSKPTQKRAGYEPAPTKDVNQIGSQIIREIVIPALTKEINSGRNFAQLRQVYNSLILATWYKKKIKDSILAQVYADKNKVSALGGSASGGKGLTINQIYEKYLMAFKKGTYNYIKEEQDPVTQQMIPRKYFSGGMGFAGNMAMMVIKEDPAMIRGENVDNTALVDVNMRAEVSPDQAILTVQERELINDTARVVGSPVTEVGELLVNRDNQDLKWKRQTIQLIDRPGDEIILDFPTTYALGHYINRIKVSAHYSRLPQLTVESYREYLLELFKHYLTDAQKVNSAIGHLMLEITRHTLLDKIKAYVDEFNEFITKSRLSSAFHSQETKDVRQLLSTLLLTKGILLELYNPNEPIILNRIEGLLHVNTSEGLVEIILIKSTTGQNSRGIQSTTAWSEFSQPFVVVAIDRLDEFIEANDVQGETIPQHITGWAEFQNFVSAKIPGTRDEQKRHMLLAAIHHEIAHEIVQRIAKKNNWKNISYSGYSIPLREEEALCDLSAIMNAQNPWWIIHMRMKNLVQMKIFKGWVVLQRLIGDQRIEMGMEIWISADEKQQILRKLMRMLDDQIKAAAKASYDRLLAEITSRLKIFANLAMVTDNNGQVSPDHRVIRMSDAAMVGFKMIAVAPTPSVLEFKNILKLTGTGADSDKLNKGGIDLSSDKAMQIKNDGQGISAKGGPASGWKFHISAGGGSAFGGDQAMLEQLQNAPGFTPEIINIQPMTDLKVFLGISPG